ncbi:THUM3 protein, partial [Polyodon spathula]|nr:THUM3 protein [Polyodon spathula]
MSEANKECSGHLSQRSLEAGGEVLVVDTSGTNAEDQAARDSMIVKIGATVPTGFEHTAAEEVKEKLCSESTISKDRGRIYFEINAKNLPQVHCLKSVDNLFVVVQEFSDYQFKDTKEETLQDFQLLPDKLPWSNPLEVWKINNALKKKRSWRKVVNKKSTPKENTKKAIAENCSEQTHFEKHSSADTVDKSAKKSEATAASDDHDHCDLPDGQEASKLLKFRVTCNRAGEKHNFTSNEAARDFGGAVQDYFLWKPDMTKFDIEVLLNIHDNEVVVAIALTEESLHKRNITHFGPTTLRSTLAYGMLRLCKPQPSDIIIDPMCGTGAIPLEGAMEWPCSYYVAGDNNELAINRTINNINHIHIKRQNKGSTACGLPIDTVQWDLCKLPIRTGSADIIVTDMPFGKRIGSRKKNWDLYPSCLKEMGRVCRPEMGKAVLLTQDKKCFAKTLSTMGHLWQKSHTVWVNVGGLHAAVYFLKRTSLSFNKITKEDNENKEPAEKTKIE